LNTSCLPVDVVSQAIADHYTKAGAARCILPDQSDSQTACLVASSRKTDAQDEVSTGRRGGAVMFSNQTAFGKIPALAPVYDVDLFHSCYVYPKARLFGVAALRFDIARLARNFALANHKNQQSGC
jgi:hypothetical protein